MKDVRPLNPLEPHSSLGTPSTLGKHCLLDLYGCDAGLLDDPDRLEQLLRQAAEAAGARVVGTLRHRFSPHGVSIVCLLAESHISIHTWPEQGAAAVDIYTCGASCDPVQACEHLARSLHAADSTLKTIPRTRGWVDVEPSTG